MKSGVLIKSVVLLLQWLWHLMEKILCVVLRGKAAAGGFRRDWWWWAQ